jgi:pilus assembly protein CpaB
MNRARMIVLVIALIAGGIAAYLASEPAPAPQPAVAKQLPTIDVLVANGEIGLGDKLTPGQLQWQTWTEGTASNSFIRRNERPDAITQLAGSIARSPFVAGEPIRELKLVKADGSGFMAAILPSGMRAVSTEISPESGAGGFILPNDRVDVILTKRDKIISGDGKQVEVVNSQVVIGNVRVLAIDQTPKEKDGQNAVVGRTATLELKPDEVAALTKARASGILSLALRSITDGMKPSVVAEAGTSITVFRGDVLKEVLVCDPLCR